MKKKYWVTLTAAVLIVGFLLVKVVVPSADSQIPVGTNIGQQAPDFTLKKLNGEDLSLSDLRGKKVILNFWATWCPPCQQEMPALERIHRENDDVTILAVDQREARGIVAEYLMLNGYTFTTVLDTDGKIGSKYLVRGIPTSYILDEDGVITAKHTGALTHQQFLDLLDNDQ